ncbi:MAG: hypothetical protein H6807_17765 [Planctomycetes bacterium]|nr:hypothetical protein [Planctomycetota bacterium]
MSGADEGEKPSLRSFDRRRIAARREAAEAGLARSRSAGLGVATACACGVVIPFLTWFFAPLASGALALIVWRVNRPLKPGTFAAGFVLASLVWCLIHGSCSAYFLLAFSLN